MAAASSSVSSPAKPPLSYAERAKRASAAAAAASQAPANGHPPTVNGSAHPADGSALNRHTNPSPDVAVTRPASPPPQSSSSSTAPADDVQAFPPMPKSSSKPPPNVWAARREQQMARVAALGQADAAGMKGQAEKPLAKTRSTVNGSSNAPSRDEHTSSASNTSLDDPFVVQIPSHSRSPASLADDTNWPEMGSNPGPSTVASAGTSVTGEGSSTYKRGEKPKWVTIPTSQLFDDPKSQASSRAHSQHRRNHPQAKPRSRQQSQARSQTNAAASNGSRQLQTGDASSAQSRSDSASHSRTTSVHSSPRHYNRGRRLPDDSLNIRVSPSSDMKKQTINEVPPVPPAPELRPSGYTESSGYPVQLQAGVPTQAHPPYTSHSPVYYTPPPPPNSAVGPYAYGALPPGGAYGMPYPPPIPSPGHSEGPGQQQPNFAGYPAYALQHIPSGQGPYPYMYPPVPYPYYAPQPANRMLERQVQEDRETGGAGHASPNLPPSSAVTRPLPPEQSAALSGYRAIETVPVSPLLGVSGKQPGINETAEASGEVIFGSLGRTEAVKSPSPVSSPVITNESSNRRSSVAFAVGFDHAPTIRIKRSASQKDGMDEIVDAVKVIDLTDQQTTLEFGTSAQSDTPGEKERDADGGQDPQILQPQPHILHFPPPSAVQSNQYNYGPPLPIPPMSMSLSSQSPQGSIQPLPHHIPSLGPLAPPGFVSPLALATPNPSYSGPASGGTGDEWEVRDFGYGFGSLSGSGFAPERLRDDRLQREPYREQRNEMTNGYGGGSRGRRGGPAQFGYFDGGRGFGGGRRGRGGSNGAGRGFPRGGFSGGRGGHAGGMGRQHPPLSVTTGPFQQQQPGLHSAHGQQQATLHMPQLSPEVPPSSYYVPSSAAGTVPGPAQFAGPSPYGQYNPGFPLPPHQMQGPMAGTAPNPPQVPLPMPMPVTMLSFPLDPTRHYLLGQVEYYFSIQNLASDLFLRNKMDSKGWIPINLIASFNRVKQLTTDVQMVKDVLSLSTLVEVRDDHVRLANDAWKSFVLPNAVASAVEDGGTGAGIDVHPGEHSVPVDEVEKDTTEDEEEDDVEFVLVREENAGSVASR